MLVVSDTSPIRALAHLKLLELLKELYGEVIIPPAVRTELLRSGAKFLPIDLSPYPFFRVRSPANSPGAPLIQGLDPGEAEAITLALEIKADALLIDELAGKELARSLGLQTVGALGILVQGKQIGRVVKVAPLVDRLTDELGFFVSRSVRADVLRLAGEQASA